MLFLRCIAFAFLAQLALPALALMPPWLYAKTMLANTVGQSKCVEVSEPLNRGNGFEIDVKACDTDTARSLRMLLKANLGKETRVNVLYPSGIVVAQPTTHSHVSMAQEVGEAARKVFADNPYFVQVHERTFPERLVIEFKKQVIQVWAVNVNDFYGNKNFVAQDAFATVLVENYLGMAVELTTGTAF